MTYSDLKDFKGLYTSADSYSTPGSPDCENVLIDTGNIEKVKGYTRITGSTIAITNMYCSTDTVLVANNTVASNASLIVYDVSNQDLADVIEGKIWNVKSVTTTSIVLEGCDTSALGLESLFEQSIVLNDDIVDGTVMTPGVVFYENSTAYLTTNYINKYPLTIINSRNIADAFYYNGMADTLGDNARFKLIYNYVPDISKNVMHFWVKVEPPDSSGYQWIFRGGLYIYYTSVNGTTYINFGFPADVSQAWNIRVGGGGITVGYAAKTIAYNTLTHVCVIFNSDIDEIEIYIDGTLTWDVVSGTVTSPFSMGVNPSLGGQGSFDSSNFKGMIKDFSILDYTVLSGIVSNASIATQLYNNTFDGQYKFVGEFNTNTATGDLSAQYLQGFSTTGGIALE